MEFLGQGSEPSCTCDLCCGCNTGSLTHCAGPGIKPVPSWIPVRLVTSESQWGFPKDFYLNPESVYFNPSPPSPPPYLPPRWHLEFLGQGSDPNCNFSLSHSCGNAGSLTHCAGPGSEPASQGSQDAASPVAAQ